MAKKSYEVLNDPFLNKGTAFTKEERKELELTGLLPPQIQTIEEQAEQVYAQYKSKEPLINKRRFLMEIFDTNRTLFYYLFSQHVVEFMPVVYDPAPAVPAPKHIYFWSVNFSPEIFDAPKIPANVIIPVPCITSLNTG